MFKKVLIGKNYLAEMEDNIIDKEVNFILNNHNSSLNDKIYCSMADNMKNINKYVNNTKYDRFDLNK